MKPPAKMESQPHDPAGQSRTGSTVEEIGRRIVLGQFEPGGLLPTTEHLAKEFAVSRLAIRETMKTLAGKGLIQARPRRGTVVRPRSDWNRLDPDVLRWHITDRPNAAFIRSVFEVRRIIEPQAAALTAERASQDVVGAIEAAFQKMEISDPTSPESIGADVAFHSAILAGTGNDFIAAFTPVIAAALNVTFRIQRDVAYEREHFVPSHRLSLDAIKSGDADDTREVYMKLLRTAEQDAIRGLRRRGM
jgi:DNA-binding FadR family transcriptional regulator